MPASHQTVKLSSGRHRSPDDGVCVMELASMLAGEPFTDHPRAVSPLLGSVLRGCNDGLDDRRRQALKRFASLSVGTAGTGGVEREREALIREWLAVGARPGWRAAFVRRLDARDPYSRMREVCRRIAAHDDEVLHQRVVGLIDALVAVGDSAEPARLPAPAADLDAISRRPDDAPTSSGPRC